MQKTVTSPASSESESYQPFEFSEFLQENWLYILLLVIAIVLVIRFSKRSKEKREKE
jgi:type II secretory pathway component PulF